VKFVLSGDGGDEIFGGYSTYKASFINDKIKNVIPFFNLFPLQNLSSLILKNDNVGILTKISRFILGMDSNTKKAHFNWRLVNTLDEIAEVLKGSNREFIADMDPYHLFSSYYSEVSDLENLDQYLYIDSKTWLTDNNLIKTDRATMLSGLEVRSPYLDKDLVTFLASCPVKFKKDKLILKEVLKSVLPTEVIKRKKRGFNAPVSSWYNINTDEYKFYTNLIFNHKFKLLLEKSV
jgi:asparagine synthase (glutamine-hydrolysing)